MMATGEVGTIPKYKFYTHLEAVVVNFIEVQHLTKSMKWVSKVVLCTSRYLADHVSKEKRSRLVILGGFGTERGNSLHFLKTIKQHKMKSIIDVFRMDEITPNTRIKILIKLCHAVNAEHGMNICEPLVYELVMQLNPTYNEPDFVHIKEYYKKSITQ